MTTMYQTYFWYIEKTTFTDRLNAESEKKKKKSRVPPTFCSEQNGVTIYKDGRLKEADLMGRSGAFKTCLD